MVLTGQIGVVHHGTGIVARIIERVTRSDAHHVVVAVSESVCLSAEPWRVRPRPISKYVHVTWTQYPLSERKTEVVVNAAWRQIGVKYNVAAFLALGVQHATGLRIPGWMADWLNRRPYVTCSQMCTEIMTDAGVAPVPDARVVCPGDWQRLLQRMGWM